MKITINYIVIVALLFASLTIPMQAEASIPSNEKQLLSSSPGITESSVLQTSNPWPMFHQNSQRTGQSSLLGPEGNFANVEWQKAGLGNSQVSPILSTTGTIYSIAGGQLVAIGPQGNLIWVYPAGSAVLTAPALGNDGTVYVGTSGGLLIALDQNGNEKWLFDAQASISSDLLISSTGTIFFSTMIGELFAVASDGTLTSSIALPGSTASSPALSANGTIYIGGTQLQSAYFYAVHWVDGSLTLKWDYQFQQDGQIISTPAIGPDGTIYIGTTGGWLYALSDAGSQAQLMWKYKTVGAIESSPAVAFDGSVYVGDTVNSAKDFNSYVYALTAGMFGGALKWRFTSYRAVRSSPAISSAGTIYVCSDDDSQADNDWGYLYAINSNGSKKWEFSLNIDCTNSSPAIGADQQLFLSSGTDLFAFWPPPEIRILSPNGGEGWGIYTTHDIKWSSKRVPGNVKIEINRDYHEGAPSGPWETLYLQAANDGIEPWTVTPSGSETPPELVIPLEHTRIRVSCVGFSDVAVGDKSDISDEDFLISQNNMGISVTNPQGGNSWEETTSHEIQWNAVGFDGDVAILINREFPEGPWEPITAVTRTASSALWLVTGPQSGNCRIRVSSVQWPNLFGDSSGYFAVSIPPPIQLLYPQGGEQFLQNSMQVIRWISRDAGDSVAIELGTGSVTVMITPSTPNTGFFPWQVPAITATQCQVKIQSTISSSWASTSATFSILPPRSDPWPKFHQDRFNSGQSPFLGPATTTLLWKYQTNGYVQGSPVVDQQNAVFSGSGDGRVYSLYPGGDERFSYQTNGYILSAMAFGLDNSIYSGNGNGMLNALIPDPINAVPRWSFNTGNAIFRSSPAVGTDGSVSFGTMNGVVHCLRADGTVRWQYQTAGQIQSSPAVGPDGIVYVGSGDSFLYALSPTTNPGGELRWRYPTNGAVFSSPAYSPTTNCVYFGSSDRYLYAVHADTGALAWRYQTGAAILSSPAIAADGTLLFGSGDQYIYAIRDNGSLKWRYKTTGAVESSPAVDANGSVFIGSDDTYFYALDTTGSLLWRYKTNGLIKSSPAIGADGTIYFGSNDKYLYALGWQPSIALQSPLGGESWAIGSKQTIYWSSARVSGNVKVELTRNYLGTATWETLFDSIANSGSAIWNVTGPASTTCRVRVSSEVTPSVFGISPANFVIAPSVLTLAPLESTALVGQPLQVEARLADLGQQPISGAEVTFTVAGAHSQTATTLTNPSGVASWSYAGLGQGMDQIIASAGGQATSPANVTWVDPQSIGIVGLTATPLVDVSGWKPLNLSASSPGAGSWSVRILSPGGDDVTSAGVLSITSPNPGTSLAATWIPSSYYALTGAHQAVAQLTDGTSTVTAAITFAVYNFSVRIRSVTFTDASFNPIAAPRAGQNFFIKVEIQNVGPSALSMVFVPVMVGSQYIGGGAMGNVLPGQVASPFIAANIAAAGSYTVRAYSWTGPGGAALAQPLILSITVLP